MTAERGRLMPILQAAIDAAQPAQFLPRHLPAPPAGKIIVLGAGKAGASMAAAAEQHYLDQVGVAAERLSGLATCRYGYGLPLRRVELIEAGHPIPDEAGVKASARALELARTVGPNDLVLVLLSGGGSANWVAPAEGLSLADKQGLTKALQRAGANIGELNCVRKHLSRIKGGRLALAAHPARLMTIAISDVPGDNPSVIASGPTVGDESRLEEARAILARYRIDAGPVVTRLLADPASETPKPGDACFAGSEFVIACRPRDALEAACRQASALGYRVVSLGADVEGEAREVAAQHALMAKRLKAAGAKAALISGGELTVTVTGQGRGGPNQEYVLGLALGLEGEAGISAIAADTDGTDGGTGAADDAAGALLFPDTFERARKNNLDLAGFLAQNDASSCFAALGDLLITGPTRTNVNDLRVILVDL